MAKIKLTKGELKKQRDALRQYLRYLPTLQLKKQQLQMEILRQLTLLDEKRQAQAQKRKSIESWLGLLAEPGIEIKKWLKISEVITGTRNIAGVDLAVLKDVRFPQDSYDLFLTPMWLDGAIEHLRVIVSLAKEIEIIEKGISILRQELRVTTQRVNLFEKVKIPEAEEAIRLIKIYLGDQMSNAVGRSKMAKRKIEESEILLAAGV